MDLSIWLEYGWVLLVLVVLEGLLAADNALILAIMVRHLDAMKRKRALFYGLAGAFILRFGALFLISYMVNIWELQAVGAAYLIFMSGSHFYRRCRQKNISAEDGMSEKARIVRKQPGMWGTVVLVELADMAFAVDSILAAVALAVALPPIGAVHIGGLNAAKFTVIFLGGFIGLVLMRFAANAFVTLLKKRPGLESAAFLIVGWVGIKLLVHTLCHPKLAILPEWISEATSWKIAFYVVLLGIACAGWFLSRTNKMEGAAEESNAEDGLIA